MFEHPDFLLSRLLFVGLLVESCEMFALRKAFADRGLFSRSPMELLTAGLSGPVRSGATLGGSAAMVAVMSIQAFATLVVILFGLGSTAGIACAVVCLATNAYLRARRQIGGSGAEQLTFMVLATFALVLAAGGGLIARRMGDAFIAAQVVLAYCASGVAKAASPIWRQGGAMTAILSAEGYGIPAVTRMLAGWPRLDLLMCWTVITWETFFPIVLVSPRPVVIAMLAIGCVFHISCAVMMGLNRFVWAFVGCYSSVWTSAMLIRSH